MGILNAMKGVSVQEYIFHRKDKAKTLAWHHSISVRGETVHVDPQLRFQRLIVFALDKDEDPMSVFEYKLCSYHPALFNSSAIQRQANKPVLSDIMWELCQNHRPHRDSQSKKHTGDHQQREQLMHSCRVYVLDSGSQLKRVLWERGFDFQSLCRLHVDYVNKRYPGATVVFDGYEGGPSIKDATHQTRIGSKICPNVSFTDKTANNFKKDNFLANKTNKQSLVNPL